MSGQQDATALRGPSTRAALVVWMAVGVALLALLPVAGLLFAEPALPGRPVDPLTAVASLLGDLVARLAGLATLGLLAAVVAFLPAGPDGTLPEGAPRLSRWIVRIARVWLTAALLMTFAGPAFELGLPLAAALRPDSWWSFVTSTPSSLAWLATAAAALVAIAVGQFARTASTHLLGWLAGAVTTVFVAVTGSVSVGLDHDWATDAMGIATGAWTLLASGALGVAFAWLSGGTESASALRRYQHAALPLLVACAVGYAVVARQQLAGTPVAAVAYGLPVLLGAAVLAMLAATWALRQFAHRPHLGVGPDLVLLIAGATCLTAAAHLPPPVFSVPQTSQVNYLGYQVDLPATVERIAGLGRPNLLWVLLCAVAIGGYVWAMLRVRRQGGSWQVSRLLWWLAGWVLTGYLALSGLWMYSTAVYSWHMLVHMTVNMMVPVLCVLGAPLNLIRAASRERAEGELPGPREVLDGLVASRVVKVLLSPPLVWVVYVGSLFAVYFSPLFGWLMRYHWAHQLMLLHFMIAGYAFFSLLIGPDRHPWHLPHLVKFALLVSVMPFHAIFAVGIMTARSVIGENFYRTIDVAWVGDLLADQNIAGQITWFTGEIPAFVAVLALAAQWFRSDSRAAARADRLVDSGEATDELAAYNELLAELAERDRREQAARPGGGG